MSNVITSLFKGETATVNIKAGEFFHRIIQVGITYKLNKKRPFHTNTYLPNVLRTVKNMKLVLRIAFSISQIFIFSHTMGRYLLVQVDNYKGIFIYETIYLLL